MSEVACLVRDSIKDAAQSPSIGWCSETETGALTWKVMARRKAVHAAVVVQQVGGPQQRQRQPC